MTKIRSGETTVCVNRRARHEYTIEETHEAGLVLTGGEVKSLREGRANLKDSYGRVRNGEAYLMNVHISNYEAAHYVNEDPTRARKLLMHKRQILKFLGETVRGGRTLVPLKVYLRDGRIKVEIALAQGKKLHDKREAKRTRQLDREARAAMSPRRSRS